jgi:hypothetical protein
MEACYKHKIYCETEAAWVNVINEDEAAITQCPNDAAHTVTAGSAVIIGSIKATDVRSEGRRSTGGANAVYLGFSFTADTWTSNVHTEDYKVPITCFLDWGHVEVVTNGNALDDVSMSIVDVDNILGYGAGFELIKYVHNVPIGPNFERSFPKTEPQKKATVDLKDLYIRVEYKRADANNKDVIVELSGEDGLA